MKRYLFVRVFLCLALCNFFTLAHAQQAEQVEVTHCSGQVEVLLEGADDYTDAQDNMILSAGDKIKTSSGASVELSFNEANTNLVRLDENTSVNISLSGDEKIEMTEGEVFSSISQLPSGSAFEIRTPTAVSGARGTDWVTKVTEEGTDVEALESVPYVKQFESSGNLSKEVTRIVPGQMTTVRKFQKPMAFRPIADTRRQKWQQVKKEVVQRGFEAMRKRQEMPPFNRKDFINKIKEKGNLNRQDLKQIRNELGDKSGPQNNLRERGQESRDPRGGPLGEKTRGMEQMGQQDFNQRRSEFGDNSGVLDRDSPKSENDFRERGQESRDPRGGALGEKTRGMEQMGQQDFNQRRNELRDNSGVLVSDRPKSENDFKERGQVSRDQRGGFLRENVEQKNQRMEERTPRMEEKTRSMEEKTQGMGKMGRDVGNGIKKFAGDYLNESRPGNREKPQPRKAGSQKTFKPAGPGRR